MNESRDEADIAVTVVSLSSRSMEYVRSTKSPKNYLVKGHHPYSGTWN